jgi:hypothetical protein
MEPGARPHGALDGGPELVTQRLRHVEETVRPAAAAVMHEVGFVPEAHDAKAQKALHRQSPVHEPVVKGEIEQAEGAHADAPAVGEIAHGTGRPDAAVENKAEGDGRVRRREQIVRLETTAARAVMALVHGPEQRVPDATVQERGPCLHEAERGERRERPERDRERAFAHGAPRGAEALR